MVNIPDREPDVFISGTTVRWNKSFSDYNPDDGWALSYTFSQLNERIDVTGVDNGDGSWLLELTAQESAGKAPGIYNWVAIVSGGPSGTDRIAAAEGRTEIKTDIASNPIGVDSRTYAEQLLEAIEDTLAGRANTDQASYSFGGVSLTRMQMSELLQARSAMRAEVAREKAADRLRRGLGDSSRIFVRL